MSRLERKSLVQLMAEALAEDIEQGVWSDSLPGYRVLQKRYHVSKITCEQALKQLETEGVLAPAEPRKKRAIVALPSARCAARNVGTLLIVSDISIKMDPVNWEQLQSCSRFWRARGGEVLQKVVDYTAHLRPVKLIDGWVCGTDTVAILLQQPPRNWVDVSEETGLHVFRIGGQSGSQPDRGSMAGYELSDSYSILFNYLRSKGHQRLLCPWIRSNLRVRPSAMVALKEIYRECFSDQEIERSFPVVDHLDADDWHGYWAKALYAHKPTVVVLEKVQAALSLVCYCGTMGIRIPDDLSIFVVEGNPIITWLRPPVAHLVMEQDFELKRFIKWVKSGFVPRGFLKSSFILIEGASVSQLD